MMAFLAIVAFVPQSASGYTLRGPISILRNSDFTAANGVTGGSGTVTDPYIIEGWEINLTGTSAFGIVVASTTAHFVIRGVYVHGSAPFYAGISLNGVTNGTVRDSNASNNYYGIYGSGGRANFILGNQVHGNRDSGINLYGAANATISGNTVMRNGLPWTGAGIDLRSNSRDLVIRDNILALNQRWGIDAFSAQRIEILGNTLFGNADNVNVEESSGVNVTQNNLRDSGFGVLVSRSWDVAIRNNTFADHGAAVHLSDSTTASVSGNTFLRDGVSLFGLSLPALTSHVITPDNLIEGKPVRFYKDRTGLVVDGESVGQIILANCIDIRIANITFPSTDRAIDAHYVRDLRVEGNTIGLTGAGIGAFRSSNVTVANNDVTSSGSAIILGQVTDSSIRWNRFNDNTFHVRLGSSTGVRVFHNEFIGSSTPAEDNAGSANQWDNGYPSGGNYWSGYAGSDMCSGPSQNACPDADGIGDVARVIDSDSRDRYPLMAPPVASTPPLAAFSVTPPFGLVGTTFTVDASGSSDTEDPLAALKVRWDWEDDGVWDTSFSSELTDRHAYEQPGTYRIRAEVRDSSRMTGNATQEVVVSEPPPNTPPVPVFTVSPSMGDVTTVFLFDGSSSFDAEDPTASLEVRWDWEDDGNWDTSWSTAKIAEHTFPQPGTYPVRLEVRDTGGISASDTRQVTVATSIQPPQIVHDPITAALAGQPIVIRADVMQGSSPVEAVFLFHLVRGEGSYRSTPMTPSAGNEFVATIPAVAGPAVIDYYIVARDTTGIEVRSPATGAHSIIVRDSSSGRGGAPYALLPAAVLIVGAAIAISVFVVARRRRNRAGEGWRATRRPGRKR